MGAASRDRHGAAARSTSGRGPARQAVAVAAGLVVLLVGSLLVLLAEAGAAARASEDLLAGPVLVAGAARDLRAAVAREVLEARASVLAGPARGPGDGPVRSAGTGGDPVADALLAQVRRGTTDPVALARLDEVAAARRDVRTVLAAGAAPRDAAARLDAIDARQQVLLAAVVARLEADVRSGAAARAQDAARRQQAVALVVTSGVVLLLVALAAVAVRVARPVRRVTLAARDAAETSLPSVAQRVAQMPVGGQRPRLSPVEAGPRDAFAGLCDAVTALQDTAVRLLVEQHETVHADADLLRDLGRRCDELLDGVLLDVAGLRRGAADPDDRAALDGIAAAAGRTRQDLASLLVLAGVPSAGPAVQGRVVDLRGREDATVRTA